MEAINKKSGKKYLIIDDNVINKTNVNDSQIMFLYYEHEKHSNSTKLFVREKNEFFEKFNMNENKNMKKPPIGLVPRFIREEFYYKSRITEIADAIKRYEVENYEIPKEWYDELKEIQDKLFLSVTKY